MESNIFSWERVWALLVRYWAENKHHVYISVILVLVIFGLLNRLAIPTPSIHREGLGDLFMISLLKFFFILGFTLHIRRLFVRELKEKRSDQLLMVSATPIEKFTYLMLVAVVIPVLFTFLLFVAVNQLFIFQWGAKQITYTEFWSYELWWIGCSMTLMLLLHCLFLQIVIGGQLLFTRNATLKAVCINILLLIVICWSKDWIGSHFLRLLGEEKEKLEFTPSLFLLFLGITSLTYFNYQRFRKLELVRTED